MSFNITYKTVCTVQLWHAYFFVDPGNPELYFFQLSQEQQAKILSGIDIRNIFEVKPSKETAEKLRKGQMVFRATTTGFVILAKAKSNSSELFIEPEEFFNLVFLIRSLDPNFQNFTNIYLGASPAQNCFYFTNIHQNSNSTKKFLSSPIQSFIDGESYLTGDYVSFDDGNNINFFEAAQNNPGSIVNNSNWEGLPGFQYVNRSDLSLYRGKKFILDFSSFNNTTVAKLEIIRSADNTKIVDETLRNDDLSELERVEISIPEVNEGKYKIEVSVSGNELPELGGEEIISNEVDAGTLGMIELINAPNLGDFGLFNGNLVRENLEFLAFFPNRRTFWRYIYDRAPQGDPNVGFVKENDTSFISSSVIPLTRVNQGKKVFGGTILPNPATNLLQSEKSSGKLISEAFIF